MKRASILLLVAFVLMMVLVFHGGGHQQDPHLSIVNTTAYHGTIGVILPNNSTIGDQVRNGIDTAYLLQGAKARPSLVYLTGMDPTSLPALDAVITVTDEISNAWELSAGASKSVHVAVASPGYAATAPINVITFSTPPCCEVSSLWSLIKHHNVIGVLGLDNPYTAAYVRDLEDATGRRVISEVFSSSLGEIASLQSLLAQNPDLLIITGGKDIPALVAKIHELGVTGPVVVSSWVGEDSSIVNDPRMDGVYTAKRTSDTSLHPFYNVYQVLFGEGGSVYAAEGYDAMMTLSRLVFQSDGCMQYVSCWYMGKSYEGAAGSYGFDDNGCGRIQMQIAQFRSGEVVLVDMYVPTI